MRKKLLLIVNPNSGTKNAQKHLHKILNIFTSYDYISMVLLTQKRGDATEFTANYGEDVDLIVCVGGDGTFNEVLTGVMVKNITTPIGYIPSGSTNDFATSLNLSKSMTKAAIDIMQGTPKNFDVGKFNDRFFSYVSSFGAFTKTTYTTPQNIKNALGHIAYILEGIKDIPSIHPEHLIIETKEKTYDGNYIWGAICNSTSIGGILSLNSLDVDMADGLFEGIFIKSPTTALELSEIIYALSNQQFNNKYIDLITTNHFKLNTNPKMDWTLDGEYARGCETIEIKNLNKAIRIVTNYRGKK